MTALWTRDGTRGRHGRAPDRRGPPDRRRLDRHPHAAARRPVLRDPGRGPRRPRLRRRRPRPRAPAPPWSRKTAPRIWRRTARVLAVPETGADPVLTAMARLGAAARARARDAQVVAVTGSVGKTGTKEALRHVLSGQGETHASAASYNNHWGVPLTLARMPAATRYGVFEIGMNHAGRDRAADRPGPARRRADHHGRAGPHRALRARVAAIADAKGEIFSGLEPGGVAIINRDNASISTACVAHAQASRAGRVVSFGEHPEADVRAQRIVLRPDLSVVDAVRDGPARHLQARHRRAARGAELARRDGGGPRARRRPRPGRPVARRADARRSGAASAPPSRSAAAPPTSSTRATTPTRPRCAPRSRRSPAIETGPRGRRIAVLGDMLELGADLGRPAPRPRRGDRGRPDRPRLRRRAADAPPVRGAAGEPPRRRAPTPPPTWSSRWPRILRSGDAVMVKGSNGSRMGRIVEALKARYAIDPARATRRAADRPMTGTPERPDARCRP